MSGETDEKQSAWTTDTLRLHLIAVLAEMDHRYQQRYDAQQEGVKTAMIAQKELVNAALISSEKAVDKAEQAQALRNIVANEFRATIADNTATMWSAKEGQSAIAGLDNKIDDALVGMRRERQALFDGVAARITVLEMLAAEGHGKSAGIHASWAFAVAVVGMIVGTSGLIMALLR